MGQVFLGRSAGGRLVAVKVIRPELAGEPGFRARFAREVAAARTVCGLFTAPVADADVQGPVPWLATAYVAGPSLADAVDAQGPLPVASVLTLAAGLAEGLEAIHAAGLVHRDLKPSNVLLAEDGPRVIDFGISRAAEASVLTQTGTVMGSPGFMSPEQAQGREVGSPSDVFSLGAVLTFAATGQGPFGTGATPALIYRVVHQQPDTAGLPRPIRPLVERCLAKDPGQRPATTDLLAALGNPQPAEDWLPAPLTDVFSRYAPPPPGSTSGPPTKTGAVPRRTPTEAAFLAQPPGGDGQPGRAPTEAAFLAQPPGGAGQPGRAPSEAAFRAQPPAGTASRHVRSGGAWRGDCSPPGCSLRSSRRPLSCPRSSGVPRSRTRSRRPRRAARPAPRPPSPHRTGELFPSRPHRRWCRRRLHQCSHRPRRPPSRRRRRSRRPPGRRPPGRRPRR